uniref:BED-type domain-containing protein n=1 Tax=Ananas comosus var. bracteatus TaxID=296719 RepID=A0A6V7NUN6_ANACO|nr:unnamed protein product [Ananas comosus var. bracteatus]
MLLDDEEASVRVELLQVAFGVNSNIIMVREKDVCWEYCEKMDGNKVRCKFCQKVLNGGISRLKFHLSRLPSKGVHPCSKVRDEVTDRVKAIIAMKEENKEASIAKRQRLSEAKSQMLSRLKHMFNSPEYSSSPYANRPHSISIIDILDDNEFWGAVEETAAISEPLLKVLRDVSWGKPAIGSIYESMTKVAKSTPFAASCSCGLLNPSIQYNPEVKFLGIIKEEFIAVLDKLLPTPELRHDITGQLYVFRKAQGMFSSNLRKRLETRPLLGCGGNNTAIQLLAYNEQRVGRGDGEPNPTQWLDRFSSALDGGDLNTRQFNTAIFSSNDHIFGL